jgi:hypothetical protein
MNTHNLSPDVRLPVDATPVLFPELNHTKFKSA